MPRLLVANNARSSLASAITDSQTSITLVAASSFPEPDAGEAFRLTIHAGDPANGEICECSSRSGNVLTVIRGSNLTDADKRTSQAWDADSIVEMLGTAGGYDELAAIADAGYDHSQATTGNPHQVSKSDVGLGNVDNVKQMPSTGGTFTGDVNFADKLAQRPELKDYAETSVAANSSTAYTVDLENGNVFEVTLTGNCTFTFSHPPASGKAGSFTLILKQDGTGSRTVTWPASVKWPGGEAPTISSDASAVDVLVFLTRDAGTTWYGMVAGQAFAVPA